MFQLFDTRLIRNAGGILVLVLAFGSTPGTTQTSPRAANILLVTIDTLRADRLGSYGYSKARTPALDRLAREGVRFERAFAPAPLTLPAHASILTGTYPSFHGIRDNSGFALSPDLLSLPELLKPAGYRTAAFVGAFVLDSKFGLAQGFDHYYDNFDLSRYESVSPGYIQRTGDEVVRETIRWLEGNSGARFFAWVHLYDPHDPYTPPEPYRSRHPDPYDGEIEFTDAQVGSLLEWLRQKQIYDDTFVAVVADHGESLGEHGESKHGFFIYNAALHVPLILKFPRGEHAGRKVAQNVSSVDLMPTVLQYLGKPSPAGIQGKGLLSLILGKNPAYRPEIYAETYYPRLQFGWSELRALITDKYKYVLAPQPELYDLEADFGERRNLAAVNQGLTGQLRENLRLLQRRHAQPVARPQTGAKLDPATREKLRSLGYVSYNLGDSGTRELPNLSDPKTEIGTYNEIVSLFEKSSLGEYSAVIPRYEQLLQRKPELRIVHYKLGQAYFQTGNYQGALSAFKNAVEQGGDVALATFDLAQTYLKLGRVDDAIVGFRRTVELDPTHYRARTNLGLLLRNQGKLQEAIQQLEAAVAQTPRSVIGLANLGVAYSMAGHHEKAEAALRKAVEIAPKDGLVRANLAAALQRMGKLEEARREMELARQLDPRVGQGKRPQP